MASFLNRSGHFLAGSHEAGNRSDPESHFCHKRTHRTQRSIQMDFGRNLKPWFFVFVLSVFFCGKKSFPGFMAS
jgi:hypothetical protein